MAIAQFVLDAVFEATLGRQTDVSIVSTTLIAALVGAPFAYVLSGIVLGDVDPFEATRRSFRVFRARKIAAAVVALFETAATVLVVVGLGRPVSTSPCASSTPSGSAPTPGRPGWR